MLITWLFAARVFSGIFGASFTTGSAYIADISPPEKRAQNFGMVGVAFGLWPQDGLTFEQMARRVMEYSHDWTTWLDLYLIFAVSTAMIPSESDREPWLPVISFFGLGVAVLFIMGWTPRVPSDVVLQARQLLDALTFALGVAAAVNAMVAVVLWILERTVERVSGKRVEYRVKRK